MIFNFKFVRVICAVCLVFTMSVLTFADTIRLKNGSVVKGKIVGFSGGNFTVAIGEGSRLRQMTFTADEIESIQFDAPQTPASNVNVSNQTAVKNPNSTVITVGQNSRNPDAAVIPPKVVTTDTTKPSNPPTVVKPTSPVAITTTNTNSSKPIELNVQVLADNTANGWTNSGWVVRKGQRIRIVGDGRVSLGNGRFTTASGISSLPDNEKLMKAVATGALIAVIGDDNNNFIYVGTEREFVAERDGALFLGVNEGNLNDNSGAFEVKVEIDPNSGN
jgi:PA-IL-like protein